MGSVRLRTKFLLSLLTISSALTCATLLMVRHTVRLQVRKEIFGDLRNSVITFQSFQKQREATLTHSAELLANLPSLKALMTTQDAPTIQDASNDLWRRAGSDLLVLGNRSARVVAFHTTTLGFTRSVAQELLRRSVDQEESPHWWFGNGNLYEVFIQPIYFGPPTENSPLGTLVLGHQIDDRAAKEVSRIASSQVAFCYGNSLVVSTLPPGQEAELVRRMAHPRGPQTLEPEEVQLGDERFLTTSVELAPGAATGVFLSVMKSFDQATIFLDNLNRILFVLGLVAVLVGSALVFLISSTFTKPLARLVAGVRALDSGDFTYPLEARGSDEVAEVTAAFERTRSNLKNTQQQLLDAGRLATIGLTASSISHDLRHPLTAIVANAEFLSGSKLNAEEREELYQEIRVAVNQMTDLVDSLLEFSTARESLRLIYGRIEQTIDRAVRTVRARPQFHQVLIAVTCEGRGEGWFDSKKLERVFHNLLLNACQAVRPDSGRVEVNIRESREGLEIRVADNGPGIPEPIRHRLFEPFVSYGKENGIGLGLTVVQKISQEHGGAVCVETTSEEGTVFRLSLPLVSSPDGILSR
ncbi:MAG: ATP-binding protein [Candidatus Acidiferrales bacterium]